MNAVGEFRTIVVAIVVAWFVLELVAKALSPKGDSHPASWAFIGVVLAIALVVVMAVFGIVDLLGGRP